MMSTQTSRQFVGWLLCAASILLAQTAQADAGRGELAGHRLGERVALDLVAGSKPQPDGSLKISVAGAGDEFDAVYLYTTPVSGAVGKIALSRSLATIEAARALAMEIKGRAEADYPAWERLRAPVSMGKTGGEMLSRLQQAPYALIVFYRPSADSFEVVLELEYSGKAKQRKAWRALAGQERDSLAKP